jgi:hypothetical protein
MEPVICPAIIFCDSIIREEGTGKFTIIGSFQFFNAPQFPLFVPTGFCMLVMLDNLDPGLKLLKVTIRIEDSSSGLTVASALATVNIPQGYDPSGSLDVPFRLQPVAFPAAGNYQAVVLVDNEVIGKRRLLIKPLSASQQTAP